MVTLLSTPDRTDFTLNVCVPSLRPVRVKGLVAGRKLAPSNEIAALAPDGRLKPKDAVVVFVISGGVLVNVGATGCST